MPKGKHLRGVGAKEQRQYEAIKKSIQKSGIYGNRSTEVAARTVMKLHKQAAHKKANNSIKRGAKAPLAIYGILWYNVSI